MHVRAKKGFGQHFLKDQNIAKKIVNSLDYSKSSSILEIGPGMGVLTKYLLEKNILLKVIELDSDSVDYLKTQYPEFEGNILSGDVLKLDISSFFENDFLLIGNLPYNISSQIFFRMLEYKNHIPEAVFMIQKEVAERIVASPGSKTYGILSVLLQAFYEVSILFNVGPTVFHPPPKVQSAVIRFERNKLKQLPVDEALFFRVVKQAFNQRRKTLRNSLKSLLPTAIVQDEIFSMRPEQLHVQDFIQLTGTLQLHGLP